MKKVFSDLPEWVFDLDEVSAGVYEVIGRDIYGHSVSAKGINLDGLIEQCKLEARRISTRTSQQT
jgi:hypothetical protein